jgi:hypothetical protein
MVLKYICSRRYELPLRGIESGVVWCGLKPQSTPYQPSTSQNAMYFLLEILPLDSSYNSDS